MVNRRSGHFKGLFWHFNFKGLFWHFKGLFLVLLGFQCPDSRACVFCGPVHLPACQGASAQWRACCIKTQIGPKFSQMASKMINQHLLFSPNRAFTATAGYRAHQAAL